MSDDPVTNVSIFGTEYKISSAVDPERTQRVARLVDRQMREVASSLSLRSVTTIAVLTAVNLTDELRREQADAEHLSKTVTSSAERLALALKS